MIVQTPAIENDYLNEGSIDFNIDINVSDDGEKTYNYCEINDFKDQFCCMGTTNLLQMIEKQKIPSFLL